MPAVYQKCVSCGASLRPWQSRLENHPGTVAKGAEGVCGACHKEHKEAGGQGSVPPRLTGPALSWAVEEARLLRALDETRYRMRNAA